MLAMTDGGWTGHERIDQRSIAMHRAIAAKLVAHPELLAVANENIERWSATAIDSLPYLQAWREMLSLPLNQLLELIVEDSERMRAMRQCSPFAGVLTPKERWRIYDAFAVGAHHTGSGSHR